jgi:glycosyltransferase involved in cell wall biosynthesis
MISGDRYGAPPAPDMKPPELVSVVIPMFNAEAVIGEQLAALAEQPYDGAWEVIIADNGSSDGSVDQALRWRARLPGLRIVDAGDKRAVGHARNGGAAAAEGDFLLFLDADDVVAPGWLRAMADAAAEHDFICGRQEPFVVRRGARRVVAYPRGVQSANGSLPWAFGGSLGVRRDVFAGVSGFREDTHFGEDVDFCWRVQLGGTPLHEVQEAVVGYREPQSLAALARQQFIWGTHDRRVSREFEREPGYATSLRALGRECAWVVTRIPYLALSERRRRLWVAMAAGTIGRIVGVAKSRSS